MYRVILVDDEPHGREGMRLLMNWEKYGFTIVDLCDGGEEALSSIVQYSPHVVVTDIRMPEMDGLALISQAKKFDGLSISPMFVVVSGYHDFQYAREALHLGVLHYLTKPIMTEEADELLLAIRDELDARERGQLTANPALSIVGTLDTGKFESCTSISLDIVEQYVREHFRQALTIKEIADKFHYHPVYLGQAFGKKFGVGLNQYIHDLRIEEAELLLRESELSNASIAEAVGYVQYGRFIKQFMKRHGMKPSQYKQIRRSSLS